MTDQIPWVDIVQDALRRGFEQSGAPVPGAKLRILVSRLAEERGVKFPPPQFSTFSSFLETLGGEIIVQRRPGQDILVVPAEHLERLTDPQTSGASTPARLRADLFEALTRIQEPSGRLAFYSIDTDSIIWHLASDQGDAKEVAMPRTSLEEEISLRENFIASLKVEEDIKHEVKKSIESDSPLRSFTTALHVFKLVQQWHSFRLSAMVAKLKEWTENTGVTWGNDWVELRNANSPALSNASARDRDKKRILVSLLSTLTEQELSRVNIPLDIVLRALQKVR